jgi:hypothetical protein
MSRPTRAISTLVLAFVLTLSAGAVVGFVYARQPAPGDAGVQTVVPTPSTTLPPTRPTSQPSGRDGMNWLSEQLSLDTKQREQIRAIWADVPHDKLRTLEERRRSLFREQYESIMAIYTSTQRADRDRIRAEYEGRVRELYRERDQAIEALYSAEQKSRREQLMRDYQAKSAEVSKERDQLLQSTGDRIRAVLSDEQRRKYDAITQRGGPGWGDRGPDRGGDRGGPDRGGHRGGPRPGSQPSPGPGGMPPGPPAEGPPPDGPRPPTPPR